eukprot:1692200-Rhodomonas_salina.1
MAEGTALGDESRRPIATRSLIATLTSYVVGSCSNLPVARWVSTWAANSNAIAPPCGTARTEKVRCRL